jgi:hypothetical protein
LWFVTEADGKYQTRYRSMKARQLNRADQVREDAKTARDRGVGVSV